MAEAKIFARPQEEEDNLAALFLRLHPARISAALDPRLTPETVRKLTNCRRLHRRLAEPLRASFAKDDLWPPAAATELLATPEHPGELAGLAGAVWHAASLRLVVASKAATELIAAIGEAAFAFGLRQGAAAVAPAQGLAPSALAEAIARDGLACLGAWLATAPKPRRDAMLLQLSADDAERTRQFDASHQAACGRVMALVWAEGSTR